MITIYPFSPVMAPVWEEVLSHSVNGTFMHSRGYMEYHGDRFLDVSILVYLDGFPVGVFPAHRIEDKVYSHEGLTYGGLVIHQGLKTESIISVFKAVLKYYHELQVSSLYIKAIPSFYGTFSLEWMHYCMFLMGGEIYRTDLSFAIPLPASYSFYSKGRKWALNKARKAGLSIEEVNDFRPFWEQVLVPNLGERHGVRPVHTVEEIQGLAESNSPFIRQFDVLEERELVAGMTVFETHTTAHVQYISSSPRGRELSALDLLIDHLVHKVFNHKSFFDFGIVNESEGKTINKGLMDWKESFGAKPFVHQFYRVETGRFGLLDIS